MKNKQNDAEELGICPIDILLCYWKSSNVQIMLYITGLCGLGDDIVEADNVNIDYPDTLALCLIGTIIGAKKACESRNFRVAK